MKPETAGEWPLPQKEATLRKEERGTLLPFFNSHSDGETSHDMQGCLHYADQWSFYLVAHLYRDGSHHETPSIPSCKPKPGELRANGDGGNGELQMVFEQNKQSLPNKLAVTKF